MSLANKYTDSFFMDESSILDAHLLDSSWNLLTFKKRKKTSLCPPLSLLLFQVSILSWPKFIDFSFFTHFPPFVASKKIYFKGFLFLCVLSFKLKGLRTIFNPKLCQYVKLIAAFQIPGNTKCIHFCTM